MRAVEELVRRKLEKRAPDELSPKPDPYELRAPQGCSLLFPTAWVGNLRPAKQNHPARSPFTNCSHCMARLVVLYFMSLRSLQILVLYTYEELLMRNRTVL